MTPAEAPGAAAGRGDAEVVPVDPVLRLVQRCRAGDPAAWTELYRQEGPRVARFLRRLLGPTRDTDDAVQQVFVELFASLARFRGEARLSTWLYSIASNVARKRLRGERYRKRYLNADQTCRRELLCDDHSTCTHDVCTPEQGCEFRPVPEGTDCDDGSACTAESHCTANGRCVGAETDCDDDNPCTFDYCNSTDGSCFYVRLDPLCDDGDPCTRADHCTEGVCAGTPFTCDDGNPCTDGVCIGDTCRFVPRGSGTACDDGDPCTKEDACDPTGACVGSPRCDDGNPCTTDTCQPQGMGFICQSASLPDETPCGATTACGGWRCATGTCVLRQDPPEGCER